jgi:hypothetical protein
VEQDLPASIADHVRESLRSMSTSTSSPDDVSDVDDIPLDEPAASTPLGI